MEYMKIVFPEDRPVFVDGKETSKTNTRFRTEEGTHTIKMGDPQNYTPRWRRPTVTGTSSLKPMIVTFELS